ncbi:MAG: glycosyltransferase family 9 protein [Burkholderiales bacterium]|nr:glycosyltransferase family 9 protein [Burkholderiales bacterium]
MLVAHNLLLGDTLMLTPLLAKLRERYPAARIAMTVKPPIALLYAGRPFGVEAIAVDLREPRTLDPLFQDDGFDLAFVPGDNRYSWLAAAAGARWIVAHAGDRPAYKSWPADELRAYPDAPGAWGDIVAGLADGPPPRPYAPADWPDPPHAPFDVPAGRYAVLHVGASSPLKRWLPENWRTLAAALRADGFEIVWSAGAGEEEAVAAADPAREHPSYAGRLDLAQLWHLVKRASLLVSPDTGIAHLGRIVGTPTVALFGPGSALLCGAGEFWRNAPFRAVTVEPFPCRDQRSLFKREIAWVRRCARTLAQCSAPRCMHAIGVEQVWEAVRALHAKVGRASAS